MPILFCQFFQQLLRNIPVATSISSQRIVIAPQCRASRSINFSPQADRLENGDGFGLALHADEIEFAKDKVIELFRRLVIDDDVDTVLFRQTFEAGAKSIGFNIELPHEQEPNPEAASVSHHGSFPSTST